MKEKALRNIKQVIAFFKARGVRVFRFHGRYDFIGASFFFHRSAPGKRSAVVDSWGMQNANGCFAAIELRRAANELMRLEKLEAFQ